MSLELFARTCAFVLGMWAPIVVLVGSLSAARRISRQLRGFAWVLLATECLVVVIASKPGAGAHHLIPFLALHAYLFQRLYVDVRTVGTNGDSMELNAVAAIAAAVIGVAWPTMHSYALLLGFDLRSPEQGLQRDELLRWSVQYPEGMMGATDYTSYDLVNLRPWLTVHGTLQTDYGAFMDLEFSGVDDRPLQMAFDRCDIPFVYMPKSGEPFTLTNGYNGQPLFSDSLRGRFAARYSLVAEGRYFDVFRCKDVR
jgi:hypothetical protein